MFCEAIFYMTNRFNARCSDLYAEAARRIDSGCRIQFMQVSVVRTNSSTARINSFLISTSQSGCNWMRRSVWDSPTILQGIGIWHGRITKSKTNDLPNHPEYACKKAHVSSTLAYPP